MLDFALNDSVGCFPLASQINNNFVIFLRQNIPSRLPQGAIIGLVRFDIKILLKV